MKIRIALIYFTCLFITTSCTSIIEVVSPLTPTQMSVTKTVTDTPPQTQEIITTTPTVNPKEVIIFILYSSENAHRIHNNEGGRLTPVEIDGRWNLKNRDGTYIKVRVIEKGELLNTVEVTNGKRVYLIDKLSKGAIINFQLIGLTTIENFLFSPDVGNNGSPIDCEKEVFCYYPSSSIQIEAFYEGDILVRVPGKDEEEGWCIFPKNDPMYMRFIGERGKYSAYRISSEETTWVWTKNNCPEVELVEIITQ